MAGIFSRRLEPTIFAQFVHQSKDAKREAEEEEAEVDPDSLFGKAKRLR